MKTEYRITSGKPYPMGVSLCGNTLSIVAEYPDSPEKECGISIQTGTETKRIVFPKSCRIGEVYCVQISDWKTEEFEYRFFVDDKEFCDPYATGISGRGIWGEERSEDAVWSIFRRSMDTYDWEKDENPKIPYEDSVIYSLHVRGFTKHPSSKVKAKGTFEGVIQKIPYLKELGITAVECMPMYEFNEIICNKVQTPVTIQSLTFENPEPKNEYRLNYWGYAKEGNFYFAPKYSYGAGADPTISCKNMIKELHKNGIECIMQIYFPENMNPAFIQEVLRFWVLNYHVDGFHIKGIDLPMLLLGRDPLLKRTKLYCEQPMTDKIYKEGEKMPEFKHIGCYREDFRTDCRRFIKGDEDLLTNICAYVKDNSLKEGQIFHITDYRGFTLADLVSYDKKHNEENGEDNRDGSDYNFSWNCGVEGPTRKKSVTMLRLAQRKNALSLLLLSQATPLLMAGDEFGRSTGGNNNAYCHDNNLNWINWNYDKAGSELYEFTKKLIAFRMQHPILHSQKVLRAMDYKSLGYPDISFHGEQAWYAQLNNYRRNLGVMYCGLYEEKQEGISDDFIYIAYNMHWIPHDFALPNLPKNFEWEIVYETGAKAEERNSGDVILYEDENENKVTVSERSVLVLISREIKKDNDRKK